MSEQMTDLPVTPKICEQSALPFYPKSLNSTNVPLKLNSHDIIPHGSEQSSFLMTATHFDAQQSQLILSYDALLDLCERNEGNGQKEPQFQIINRTNTDTISQLVKILPTAVETETQELFPERVSKSESTVNTIISSLVQKASSPQKLKKFVHSPFKQKTDSVDIRKTILQQLVFTVASTIEYLNLQEQPAQRQLLQLQNLDNEIVTLFSYTNENNGSFDELIDFEPLKRLFAIAIEYLRKVNFDLYSNATTVVKESESIAFLSIAHICFTLSFSLPHQISHQLASEELIETILDHLTKITLLIIVPSKDAEYIYDEATILAEEENNTRRKRKRASIKPKEKHSIKIIETKFSQLLDEIAKVINIVTLSDSLMLKLISLCLPLFFIQNIEPLQSTALNVVRIIFTRYAHQRYVLFGDLLSFIQRMPSWKIELKTFSYHSSSSRINLISALLIEMCSCCTGIESISSQPFKVQNVHLEDSQNSETKLVVENSENVNSFETFVSFSNMMISTLLQKSVEDPFRQFFTVFLTDLLHVHTLPECSTERSLIGIATALLAKHRTEVLAQRFFQIELIGMILSILTREKVVHYSFQFFKEKPNNNSEIQSEDSSMNDNFEVFNCYCGKNIDKGENIACVECKRIFHTTCNFVQILNWTCDGCVWKHFIDKWWTEENKVQPAIQYYRKFLVFFNAIKGNSNALKFDLSFAFYSENVTNLERNDQNRRSEALFLKYKKLWEENVLTNQSSDISNRNFPQIPQSNVVSQITQRVNMNSIVYKNMETLLVFLLKALCDPMVKIRSKAMKSLALILNEDPNMIGDKLVQQSVCGRLLDSAVSVREVAVGLVGRHILDRPQFAEQYLNSLVDRIYDTGLSVRKNVVQVCFAVLRRDTEGKHTEMCRRVLSRINDENSIQKIVIKNFYELWFSPISKVNSKYNNSSLPISQRVNQLCGILGFPEVPQLLRKLTKKVFKQFANEADEESPQIVCERICEEIIERIIKSPNDPQPNDFFCLEILSQSSPSVVAPFIPSMIDFLSVNAVLPSLLSIFSRSFQHIKKGSLTDTIANSLSNHFIALSARMGIFVSGKAIEALASLSSVLKKENEMIVPLFFNYYLILDQTQRMLPSSIPGANVKNVMRSLFIVGSICRHCDLTKVRIKQIPNGLKGFEHENRSKLPNQIFSLVSSFTYSSVHDIRLRAIHSIGGILVCWPELLTISGKLSPTVVLKNALNEKTNPQIIETAMLVLSTLLDQEISTHTYDSDDSEQTVNERKRLFSASSSNDVRASQRSTLVQSFIPDIIMVLMEEKDPKTKTTAASLLLNVVEHGLSNPTLCCSALLASQADSVLEIKNTTRLALKIIIDYYPNAVYSRFSEAIKLSFSIYGLSLAIHPSQNSQAVEPVFASFYQMLPQKGKQAFVGTLLKLIEEDKDPKFSSFICSILAFLPYTSEEPLQIVYTINRLVLLKGGSSLSALKGNTNEMTSSHPQIIQALCLMVILSLKSFIKTAYSLTEDVCRRYIPSTSLNNVVLPTSFSSDSVLFSEAEKTLFFEARDALKRNLSGNEIYAIFKQMMKRDETDTVITSISAIQAQRRRGRKKAQPQIKIEKQEPVKKENKKRQTKRRRMLGSSTEEKHGSDEYTDD